VRVIVDTREKSRFESSHVEGAIHVPPEEFMGGDVPEALRDVPKDAEIILYCLSGARSNICMMMLRQHGFTNLVNGVSELRTRAIISA